MGIGRKATDQRTLCRKFLATPLVSSRACRFILMIIMPYSHFRRSRKRKCFILYCQKFICGPSLRVPQIFPTTECQYPPVFADSGTGWGRVNVRGLQCCSLFVIGRPACQHFTCAGLFRHLKDEQGRSISPCGSASLRPPPPPSIERPSPRSMFNFLSLMKRQRWHGSAGFFLRLFLDPDALHCDRESSLQRPQHDVLNGRLTMSPRSPHDWRAPNRFFVKPFNAGCSKLLLSKCPAPYWSNPPFFIFDIRALWRSALSARAPECQKEKMVGSTNMAKC